MSAKLRLVNVSRGFWGYSANIEWNGRIVGYVQKDRRDESYYAFSGGKAAARARTLAELRQDLRESFIEEPPVLDDDDEESSPSVCESHNDGVS